jgi:hypothetical protein
MKKFPKLGALTYAALLTLLAAVAWGGVAGGVLTSSQADVNLSQSGGYKDGHAANEVRLSDQSGRTVNLTGNITLGAPGIDGLVGYAPNHNDVAAIGAAGGAIYLAEGETLNFFPAANNGIKNASSGGSLRLFGQGTTNLRGSNND